MIGIVGLIISLTGLAIVISLHNIVKELSYINEKLDNQEQKEIE